MAKLSEQEVEAHLKRSRWEREGEAIARQWAFADFAAALAFVNSVGEAAEAADHHPDILLHGWNKVRFTLSTHSEGGLSEADFALAEKIDALAGGADTV